MQEKRYETKQKTTTKKSKNARKHSIEQSKID